MTQQQEINLIAENVKLHALIEVMRNANARMGARLRQVYIAIDRDDLIISDIEGEIMLVSHVSQVDVTKRRGRYT